MRLGGSREEWGGEEVKAVCSCGSKLGGGTTTQYHPYCYLLNFNTNIILIVVGGIVGTLPAPNGGYKLQCLRCAMNHYTLAMNNCVLCLNRSTIIFSLTSSTFE